MKVCFLTCKGIQVLFCSLLWPRTVALLQNPSLCGSEADVGARLPTAKKHDSQCQSLVKRKGIYLKVIQV